MSTLTVENTAILVAVYTHARDAGNPISLCLTVTQRELSTVHDIDLTIPMIRSILRKDAGVETKAPAGKSLNSKGKAKGPTKSQIVALIADRLNMEAEAIKTLEQATMPALAALFIGVTTATTTNA